MTGINLTLDRELTECLLRCGPFSSDSELQSTFTDDRIAPWRNKVFQANNPHNRVQALKTVLHDQANSHGENALMLFLCVLRDHTDPDNMCYHDLNQLAQALKRPDMSNSRTSDMSQPISVSDAYTLYENALDTLIQRLGLNHPRIGDALQFQQQLRVAIIPLRRYDPTPTNKVALSRVIDRLNTLSLETLGVAFASLGAPVPMT